MDLVLLALDADPDLVDFLLNVLFVLLQLFLLEDVGGSRLEVVIQLEIHITLLFVEGARDLLVSR